MGKRRTRERGKGAAKASGVAGRRRRGIQRANGRNLAVAGIENGEKAVEMIRQRLTKS